MSVYFRRIIKCNNFDLESSSIYFTQILTRKDNVSHFRSQRVHFCASNIGQSGNIDLKYVHGMIKLSVKLPSRNENCLFTLKPISDTLEDLTQRLQEEDKGIDVIQFYTTDGDRIAKKTSLHIAAREDFYIKINDNKYHCVVPKLSDANVDEQMGEISALKNQIAQMYSLLNVEQFQLAHEDRLKRDLEELQAKLQPLEESRKLMHEKAARRTNLLGWVGLGLMGVQFGFLARLTWFEYSWDIMEPVTYFVGYGTAIACYAYFILTKQDYFMPQVLDREHLFSMHKQGKNSSFDFVRYNQLREAVYQAQYNLRRLRDPLQLNLPIKQLENKPHLV